jgi:hypothetical protein
MAVEACRDFTQNRSSVCVFAQANKGDEDRLFKWSEGVHTYVYMADINSAPGKY